MSDSKNDAREPATAYCPYTCKFTKTPCAHCDCGFAAVTNHTNVGEQLKRSDFDAIPNPRFCLQPGATLAPLDETFGAIRNESNSTVEFEPTTRTIIVRAVEPVPIHRWPFRESPGEFAIRLEKAMNVSGFIHANVVLAAIRTVLIEHPPVLADWLHPGAAAKDAAAYNLLVIALRHAFPDFQDAEPITTERVLALGKKFNDAVLGIRLPDVIRMPSAPPDHRAETVTVLERAFGEYACMILKKLDSKEHRDFENNFAVPARELLGKLRKEMHEESESTECNAPGPLLLAVGQTFVHPSGWSVRAVERCEHESSEKAITASDLLDFAGWLKPINEYNRLGSLLESFIQSIVRAETPPTPAPSHQEHSPDCSTRCREQAIHKHECDCGQGAD